MYLLGQFLLGKMSMEHFAAFKIIWIQKAILIDYLSEIGMLYNWKLITSTGFKSKHLICKRKTSSVL